MSWEQYDFDMEARCACGNGTVMAHCYEESDDWGRYRSGVYSMEIICPECREKYHVQSIALSCPVREPGDTGHEIYTYLVPNRLQLPRELTPESDSYFHHNTEEEIVNMVRKDDLKCVIVDMEESKYSTRVIFPQSEKIIKICKRRLHTRSLKVIVPYLKNILDKYDTYKWNPDTIKKYREEEEENIAENKARIKYVRSKSHPLYFRRY